jgi:uracil-DNA glycosylase
LGAKEVIKQIANEVAVCLECDLHYSRKNTVAGEGPADAEIVFIGEGPGFHENEQGRPFVGAAGKFLEDLLRSINLTRSDVFITNIVKCRPPGNRDPLPEEINTCTSLYLERQIQVINPKVVVTLGRYSLERYLPKVKISSVHGQAFKVKGRLVVPMYHPAAALHQGSLRPVLERDFARLPELISKSGEVPEILKEELKPDQDPKQLSLF